MAVLASQLLRLGFRISCYLGNQAIFEDHWSSQEFAAKSRVTWQCWNCPKSSCKLDQQLAARVKTVQQASFNVGVWFCAILRKHGFFIPVLIQSQEAPRGCYLLYNHYKVLVYNKNCRKNG